MLFYEKNCFNTKKAENYLNILTKSLGYDELAHKKNKTIIIGQYTIKVIDELNEIKKNGKANQFQHIYDSKDEYISTSLGIGSFNTIPGLNISITSNHLGKETKINNEGIIESPLITLSNDIVSLRKEFVDQYNNNYYLKAMTLYRACMFMLSSYYDAFLYSYYEKLKIDLHDLRIEKLASNISLEERVESWMQLFCAEEITEIKSGKEYCYFKRLKKERNNLVHPKNTDTPYEISKIVENLNMIPEGLGSFLELLRKKSNQPPLIGCIQLVKNAQKISLIGG